MAGPFKGNFTDLFNRCRITIPYSPVITTIDILTVIINNIVRINAESVNIVEAEGQVKICYYKNGKLVESYVKENRDFHDFCDKVVNFFGISETDKTYNFTLPELLWHLKVYHVYYPSHRHISLYLTPAIQISLSNIK